MPITRKFLDWSRPALPAVVEFLVQHYDVLGVVDLQEVIVVVPARRAKRRLHELLGERAGSTHHPPEILTPEDLPEELYKRKRPFASEFVQKLAWAEALRSTPRNELALVVPRPPPNDAFEQWLSLGELLWSQHRELAADGLDFRHVAGRGAELDGFDELDRWRALRRLQEKYLASLDALGLWDKQTARLFAIEHGECATERDIVLVATADLNTTLRRMLDQVADRVTALVHAPQRLAKRFDEHGCLVPEVWQDVPIDLDARCVHVVDGPADQADEVARVLAGYEGRYRADEITVGVPDESLVPQVERQLRECGVSTRWVAGTTIARTAPFRLLFAVADRLATPRFDTFAALVRHPDVTAWLSQQGVATNWLALLDRYYARRLQSDLGDWPEENDRETEAVRRVFDAVAALLAPLAGENRPLGTWTPPIVQLVLAVYANVNFDRDDQTDRVSIEAAKCLHEAFVEHTSVPDALAPVTGAATAIRLALDRVANDLVPPLPDENAVEILGWLELPLDDAEALVVTTFNEGFVPKSVNAHLFLPNALRTRLGILDNDRRYARDAYALSTILASRERVDLIVGRRDTRDDALAPSRLLFATKPPEIAARVLAFLEPEDAPPPIAGSLTPGVAESELWVPRPRALEHPVTRLSVTAFRTYLACPYRFYLKHVLRLEDVDDSAEELDGGAFGSLVHEVLARFGTSAVRDATDADAIRGFLRSALDEEVERRFRSERRPAVNVQIEQMKARLDAFAAWQAGWAADGWRIAFVEQPQRDATVRFPADREPAIDLVGRIDRIDRYRDENRWAVLDYKTGESAKSPENVHQSRGEWVDLQLPLYRHLVEPLGVVGEIDVGYVNLPKDLEEVGVRIARWDAPDLDRADRVAADTIARILAEEFWPPRDVPVAYFAELGGICQDGVLEPRLAP